MMTEEKAKKFYQEANLKLERKKQQKREGFTVLLPVGIVEKLKQIATQDKVKTADIVDHILRLYFKEQGEDYERQESV